ncbi:MAG: Bug family tripartite tricarboxylate transporter substrate binding protein [Betaproteobacteria bacterium]
MKRIVLCFLYVLAVCVSTLAQAQAFPSRPVRILVPFPPGGGVDITARAIAVELAKQLGQPVTVENRPGAGGNVAAAEVAKAAPDGHTLFLTLNALHAISPVLYSKLPFDALKDFAWVTTLVQFNNVLVTRAESGVGSVQDLVSQAKAQPGKINFASSGNGTNLHLTGELFKMRAGVDLVHVPYKGSAPAMTDLLGGQVQIMFETIPAAISHIRGGKLKALGVTGAKRSALFPQVPTIAESGLPGFEVQSWYGLVAPAATPRDVISRLNAESVKGANAKEFRDRLEPLGFDVITGTPERMGEMVKADAARWAPVVKASGAKID